MGEQFSEKDNAFIDDCLKSTDTPYGEPVLIKRYAGITDPGDPARGIQAKAGYMKIPVKAIITNVEQKDVIYSGGLYQIGDVRLSLKERLSFIDNKDTNPANDRIVVKGQEYRIVGMVDDHVLVGRETLYSYVLRKVGNA